MTFQKQFFCGVALGALSLCAAYVVVYVDDVLLGNESVPFTFAAWLAGILAFAGLFAIAASIWRGLARILFVKTGAIEGSWMGDFLRDIPFWQWVLHIDKDGKDRDVRP